MMHIKIGKMLIGLSGKCGVGKNYVAEKVLPSVMEAMAYRLPIPCPSTHPWHVVAFGDQLKIELGCRQPELSYEDLFENKTQETRRLLQTYGTENGRQRYHENIWVRAMELWVSLISNRSSTSTQPSVFLITDVRFPNEAEWILQRSGLLLRVEAPERNAQRIFNENQDMCSVSHASETALDAYAFENVLYNDPSDPPLEEQLERILSRWFTPPRGDNLCVG
jgi:hypothetical protein